MAEESVLYSFVTRVTVNKGKEGRTASVTIPPSLRDALGFKGGEVLQIQITQIIQRPVKRA